MATTDVILRVTTAFFSGTGSSVQVNGICAVKLTNEVYQRLGRSDGAFGTVAADNVGEMLTGSLISDDEAVDKDLLTGSVGMLVCNYKKVNGGSGVLTIGAAADTPKTGVLFTGTNDISIDLGDGNGPTMRVELPWVSRGLASNLATFGASAPGTAAAYLASMT